MEDLISYAGLPQERGTIHVPVSRAAGAPLVAAAFLAAALAASPGTTRATPSSGPSFPKACGGYAVAVTTGGSPTGDGEVVLRMGGRLVYRAEAFGILDVACAPLTGHPVPDLVITEWTGGRSCCETIEILQLHGGPRRVLEFWGKIEEIADYRGTGDRLRALQTNEARGTFRAPPALCGRGLCGPG